MSAPAPGAECVTDSDTHSLLLVDDEPHDLRELEEILHPLGCKLVTASGGAAALEALARGPFAAVLMDASLPAVKFPGTTLILLIDPGLTAAQVLRLHRGERVDCLVRPLVPELVRARVSVLVELARKERQVAELVRRERASEELHRAIFQEQSERLLGEATARNLRTLSESLPQQVWTADAAGQLTFVNGVVLAYFGRNEPEVLGDGWLAVLHPGDVERVAARWVHSLRTGEAYQVEFRLRRHDDKYLWHLGRARPIRDADGRIVSWLGTNTDIDEQIRAREEITERSRSAQADMLKRLEWEARERQLRHIALRADVSFALTQRTSLREMLQFCADALVTHLGAAFARVWTLNDAGDVLELQASAGMHTQLDGEHARIPVGRLNIGLIAQEKRALFSNEVQQDERVCDRAWAEREGMISFAGHPLIAGDKLVGVIAMFARRKLDLEAIDAISSIADVVAQGIARKSAEDALEAHAKELARSNAELERFSYIASHDLQEPLRMVASYTQLLGRRYKGKLDQDADEFIAFAVDGAQRMQTLINDLLAFSRVGTKPGAMSEVNLEQPLQTALLNLRSTIEEAKAEITYGPMPTVLAYDRQLVQLFQNLIGNAIKFGHAGAPRVSIEAHEIDGGVQVSVKDNGIGIDPAFFDRLFVVFQRLNNRTEYAGNGIGLAICKKIVERHAGAIWVDSKLGEGATFHFTLRGATP